MKRRIGSVFFSDKNQRKIIVEGDENLVEDYEVLLKPLKDEEGNDTGKIQLLEKSSNGLVSLTSSELEDRDSSVIFTPVYLLLSGATDKWGSTKNIPRWYTYVNSNGEKILDWKKGDKLIPEINDYLPSDTPEYKFVFETIDISNTEGNPRWLDPTKLGNYSVLKELPVKLLVTKIQPTTSCYLAFCTLSEVAALPSIGFNSDGAFTEDRLETATITYDGEEYVPWNKPSEEGKGKYLCFYIPSDTFFAPPIPTNMNSYNYPLSLEYATAIICLY